MGYNWYRKDFEKKLNKLKSREKNATGRELELIQQTINILSYIVYLDKDEESTITVQKLLERDYKYLNGNRFIKKDIKDFSQFALPEDMVYGEYVDIKYPLSNDELIELVHDFYKNATDKVTYDLFLKIYNGRKNHLHFYHNENTDFCADATFLPFYRQSYIQMNRSHCFDDVHTLTHEIGHGIQAHRNFSIRIFDSIFEEIVSLFFEYISLEYYSKDIELQEMANVCLMDAFDKCTTEAINIDVEFDIINRIRNNSSNNMSSIRRGINDYIKHAPKEALMSLLDCNPTENLIYVTGSIVAIELFMIYLKDPDKAFYMLYKIIDLDMDKYDDKQYYDEIVTIGINPLENVDNYKNHLIRKL